MTIRRRDPLRKRQTHRERIATYRVGVRLSARFSCSVVLVALLASATQAAADEPAPVRLDADVACSPGWESTLFVAARGSVVRITDGSGWGAGFAWNTPRQIVTAMHVVARARSFDIVFGDGPKGRASSTEASGRVVPSFDPSAARRARRRVSSARTSSC